MNRVDGTNMKKSAPCAPSLYGGLMMEGIKNNNGIEKYIIIAILNFSAIFLDCVKRSLFFDKISSCLSFFVVILARTNVIMGVMNGRLRISGNIKISIRISPSVCCKSIS